MLSIFILPMSLRKKCKFVERIKSNELMDLYLIVFASGNYKAEKTYMCHKDLFIELEKHFTLHMIPYTETETVPSNAYKLVFIADGCVADIAIANFSSFPLSHYFAYRRTGEFTLCSLGNSDMGTFKRHAGENHPWQTHRNGQASFIALSRVYRKTKPERKADWRNRNSGSLAHIKPCRLPISQPEMGSKLY